MEENRVVKAIEIWADWYTGYRRDGSTPGRLEVPDPDCATYHANARRMIGEVADAVLFEAARREAARREAARWCTRLRRGVGRLLYRSAGWFGR